MRSMCNILFFYKEKERMKHASPVLLSQYTGNIGVGLKNDILKIQPERNGEIRLNHFLTLSSNS